MHLTLRSRAGRLASRSRRRGATIVEAALVMSVFLLLLFGIFEYCRFIFVLHVTNNAAREGARYASVNLNCSTGTQMLPAYSVTQVSSTSAAVIAYTTMMMSNVNNQISGYNVQLFAVAPAGLTTSPPTIEACSSGVTAPVTQGTVTASAWNSTQFPNCIGVNISGNYTPLSFLFMPSTIPINITALMVVE